MYLLFARSRMYQAVKSGVTTSSQRIATASCRLIEAQVWKGR